MNTSISRHDLSYLTSAALLVVATVVAATGLASDLWDLNDFIFHKYAGYILASLALVHVYLHWGRLVSYTRWRLRGHPAHEWSKSGLLSFLGAVATWGRQPPRYKEYSESQRITLPPSGEFQGLLAEEAIQRRRSRRRWRPPPR